MTAGAVGGGTGDLDGVFHSFSASGHENGLLLEIAGHGGIQPFGQPYIVFIGHNLMAGMGEMVDLVLDRFNDCGVAVTGIDHGDAGAEIDVAIALDIPDFRIFGPVGVDLRHHSDAA